MTKKTYFTQIGMGSDLHGSNDTKAAIRAVKDAIQNNNMLFLKHIKLPGLDQLLVDVVIATPNPAAVDTGEVGKTLPIGTVTIDVHQGGMLVDADHGDDPVLVAIAAVTISVDH